MISLDTHWPVWLAVGDVLPAADRITIANKVCDRASQAQFRILKTGDSWLISEAPESDIGFVLRGWLLRYSSIPSPREDFPALQRALHVSLVLNEVVVLEPSELGDSPLEPLEQCIRASEDEATFGAALARLSTSYEADLAALTTLKLASWCFMKDREDLLGLCLACETTPTHPWIAAAMRQLAQMREVTAARPRVELNEWTAQRIDSLDFEQFVSELSSGRAVEDKRRLLIRDAATSDAYDTDLSRASLSLLRGRQSPAYVSASAAVTQAFTLGAPTLARSAISIRGLASLASRNYTQAFEELVCSEDGAALRRAVRTIEDWPLVFQSFNALWSAVERTRTRRLPRMRAYLEMLREVVRISPPPPTDLARSVARRIASILRGIGAEFDRSLGSLAIEVAQTMLGRVGWSSEVVQQELGVAILGAIEMDHSKLFEREGLVALAEYMANNSLPLESSRRAVAKACAVVRSDHRDRFLLGPALRILASPRAIALFETERESWENAANAVRVIPTERPWVTREVLEARSGERAFEEWLRGATLDRYFAESLSANERSSNAGPRLFDLLAFHEVFEPKTWELLAQRWKLVLAAQGDHPSLALHGAIVASWRFAKLVGSGVVSGHDAQKLLSTVFDALVELAAQASRRPTLLAPFRVPFSPEPSPVWAERLTVAILASGSVLGSKSMAIAQREIKRLADEVPAVREAIGRAWAEMRVADQRRVDTPFDDAQAFYASLATRLTDCLWSNDAEAIANLLQRGLTLGPRAEDIPLWAAAVAVGIRKRQVNAESLRGYIERLDVLDLSSGNQAWLRDLRPFAISFNVRGDGSLPERQGLNTRWWFLESFIDFDRRLRMAAFAAGVPAKDAFSGSSLQVWRALGRAKPSLVSGKMNIERLCQLRNQFVHDQSVDLRAHEVAHFVDSMRSTRFERTVEQLLQELAPKEKWTKVRMSRIPVDADDPRFQDNIVAAGLVTIDAGARSIIVLANEARAFKEWCGLNGIDVADDQSLLLGSQRTRDLDIQASGRYIDHYRGVALVVELRNLGSAPSTIVSFVLELEGRVLTPTDNVVGLAIAQVRWWNFERVRIAESDMVRLGLFFPVDESLSVFLKSQGARGVVRADSSLGQVSGPAAIEGRVEVPTIPG